MNDEVVQAINQQVQSFRDKQQQHAANAAAAKAIVDAESPLVSEYQVAIDDLTALVAKFGPPANG